MLAPQHSCASHSGAQQPAHLSQVPGRVSWAARPGVTPCRLHRGQVSSGCLSCGRCNHLCRLWHHVLLMILPLRHLYVQRRRPLPAGLH